MHKLPCKSHTLFFIVDVAWTESSRALVFLPCSLEQFMVDLVSEQSARPVLLREVIQLDRNLLKSWRGNGRTWYHESSAGLWVFGSSFLVKACARTWCSWVWKLTISRLSWSKASTSVISVSGYSQTACAYVTLAIIAGRWNQHLLQRCP